MHPQQLQPIDNQGKNLVISSESYNTLEWSLKAPLAPILVIDYRVYAWNIYKMVERCLPLLPSDPQELANYYKACWAILINQGVSALPPNHRWNAIVVDDNGGKDGYWKVKYLADRGFPVYKGSRPSTKPDSWYSVAAIGIEYIQSANSPLHYFSLPGYEADDIAGAIVRLHRQARDKTGWAEYPGKLGFTQSMVKSISARLLALSTVDTDWLQLVDNATFWFNTAHYEPRVRGIPEALSYWYKRHRRNISSPTEIAKDKAQYGDSSDDLPPGCPIEVVDLLNPPGDHDILSNPEVTSRLLLAMSKPESNLSIDHYAKSVEYIRQRGLPMPK